MVPSSFQGGLRVGLARLDRRVARNEPGRPARAPLASPWRTRQPLDVFSAHALHISSEASYHFATFRQLGADQGCVSTAPLAHPTAAMARPSGKHTRSVQGTPRCTCRRRKCRSGRRASRRGPQ
eukprot:1186395-Rhodomonas_salina.1